MIKYNVKTINDWLYNSNPIKKLYYNGMVRYRRFVANGQPTPPVFDGKFKAIKNGGIIVTAQCDSSSAVTYDDFKSFNTQLESVEIGQCVTSIGDSAFNGCTSLSAITIPSGVTSIGNSAFNNCRRLTSCTIGNGVTSIGNYAFNNCRKLSSVTINATTPPTLGSSVFENTNNYPIYVPDASVDTYKTAANWSSYASRIKPISEKPQ